jgi:hypothetical protein
MSQSEIDRISLRNFMAKRARERTAPRDIPGNPFVFSPDQMREFERNAPRVNTPPFASKKRTLSGKLPGESSSQGFEREEANKRFALMSGQDPSDYSPFAPDPMVDGPDDDEEYVNLFT